MNALLGIRLSERDDIKSLAYTLIYLVHGSLPWKNINGDSPEVLDMRTSISNKNLTTNIFGTCFAPYSTLMTTHICPKNFPWELQHQRHQYQPQLQRHQHQRPQRREQ